MTETDLAIRAMCGICGRPTGTLVPEECEAYSLGNRCDNCPPVDAPFREWRYDDSRGTYTRPQEISPATARAHADEDAPVAVLEDDEPDDVTAVHPPSCCSQCGHDRFTVAGIRTITVRQHVEVTGYGFRDHNMMMETAREVLYSEFLDDADLEHDVGFGERLSEVEATCQACGHTFVPTTGVLIGHHD